MSKRQKPTLMILAGAVILAAVGTYTMLQNEQQQPEKIQSMNQTPEEEKSVTEKTESTSQGEEVKAQNETGPKVGETVETSSGLKYRILQKGEGNPPVEQSQVKVHYRGRLEDGTEFDSSYKRGQPATFPVNGVIRGWTEALMLMKPGDKWELTIPPELGYGSRAVGNVIPPNSTLIFEVELLEIL